ncbi:AAA family ATPase [Leptolyngbya sp. DQ-M1]|uniref:AAA family ATPase n=1 Tax=Leptolyngbya sp. DQ-M1 TaxID=2933920 RepID=UPI003296D784
MQATFDPIAGLSGYSAIGILYQGSRTLVYRAVRIADQTPVILKRLRHEASSLEEQVRFRNQYTLVKQLEIPGIVKVIGLESCAEGDVLVMEDFGELSLADYLQQIKQQYQQISIVDFLSIALQLSITLGHLHNHKIVHKDIKPANILIDPDAKQIRLIDFSIASQLSDQTQELQHPNQLEGTLAYLSPEQTGRMNRLIDYRSDFYSLGVTLYELLTGQVPFVGEDALEIVYSHLAKEPPELQALRAEVPGAIAKIVMKLMAKNAEDRYQSAKGLQADLQHCLDEFKTTGAIAPFEIGRLDRIAQLNIPEKLYGRNSQLQTVLAAFERARQGSCELVVIGGYSGVGKTALIRELFKPVTASHAHFIAGKFDQFKREVPYTCIAEAYGELIRQILGETQEQVEFWRDRFSAAVGLNGQAVIDIIPELEWLIGQQPPLPEIPPVEAQNRFYQTFSAFMLAASTPEAPLVEFMDDLQWADAATISRLPEFLSCPENRYRLLILAYRDNEVDLTHLLMQVLAQLKSAQLKSKVESKAFRFEHITLEPLSLHDVMQFLADTLCCHYFTVQPLAKLLYDKTQGNPFFLMQLLKSLHSEDFLTFDFETNSWQWDIKQIRQFKISEDVVELMTAKFQTLSAQTQFVLQLAACIGNQFDLKTLSTVSQISAFQTLQALWSAIEQEFILPLDQHYRAFLDETGTIDLKVQNPKFKFFHDRVQQAAYTLIAEDQKQVTHLEIARLLQQHLSNSEIELNIFEIVNHWNIAIDLVVSDAERSQLVQLNQIAASKAKSSAAYQHALNYLQAAIRCLPNDCWQTNYHATLTLYEDAAQMAYLTGQFVQLEALCNRVSANSLDLFDRVEVWEFWIQACMAQNHMVDAVNFAIVILQALGVSIRKDSVSLTDATTAQPNLLVLSEAEVESLAKLPPMRDRRYLAALRICASVEPIVYFTTSKLHRPLVETAIRLSMLHGNAPETVFFYAVYGLVLCSHTASLRLGLQFGRLASKLLNNVVNKDLQARTLVNLEGFIKPWEIAVRQTVPQLLKAHQLSLEGGDLEFAALALHYYCVHAYFAGNKLQPLHSEMLLWEQKMDSLHQEAILNFHKIWTSGVAALTSQPSDVYRLIQQQSHCFENNLTEGCYRLLNTLILSYGFGRYDIAIATSNQLKTCIHSITGMYCVAIYNLYDSLVSLAACSDYPADSASMLESVALNQKQMRIWARFAPMNFQHKYDLVEAERYRILGETYAAMEQYDRSITGAIEHGYIQEAALANELAAKFYFSLSKPKIAQAYLIEAYQQYQQWGATAKVKQLEAQYPRYFSTPDPIHPAIITHTKSSSSTNSGFLDLATILKATEAISSELVLNQLLDRLLHIILENAGAQKGCIVLDREGELFIEVADTDQENSAVVVEAIPLTQSQDVPLTVLQYVARTQTSIVSSDAASESTYANDPYVLKHQPQSLLCTPMIYQGKLIGLMYLENNLVKGAFTTDRLETVKILTGQAAIAIENAKLYAREQERSYQIEQSQQRLNLLIQQSPIAVLEWNKQFEIQAWNHAAEAVFGYSAEEVMGKHCRMFIPEEFQPYVNEVVNGILQQTGGTHAINENIRKDGERITCEWFNAPLIAQNGEILGGVSIALDVTDRQRLALAIQEKNQSLEQALTKLQQAQMQMVQSEKMSALGNLVAGVAHEINNPLGFLNGSINNAAEFVQDLLKYVDLYQQHHPNAAPPVQEFADEIDVEFLKADLPKLLRSMRTATERIKAISTSLRTFSRADTEGTITANLREGIDSTILILKYRLKANDQRPAIEVVTNYGDIPNVDCFPGQLNQVFMNILANAIDMFDEMAQHSSFTELEANPYQITIQTAKTEANKVEIRIRDNGKGMSEEVKSKIFDHLFTTKAVGKGTGLGLAIVRQIVVEKHQGAIEVHSAIAQGTEFVISLPIKHESA